MQPFGMYRSFYFGRDEKQPARNAFGQPQAPKRCLLGVSPSARSVLLNAFAVQRSPPATRTPKPLLNSSLVLANFVSFASPQAARLTHFVARPLPTQPDLLGLRGVPLELAARSCERFGTRQAQRPSCSLP